MSDELKALVERVFAKHRRHIELSPGVGADLQRYALATLDDVQPDLERALLSRALRQPVVGEDNLGPIPSRLSADWRWPIYQNKEVMAPLIKSLQAIARPGERVIYRDAFRWKDAADDSVLSNHYECQGLAYLAESFGYEVVCDFNHAAVIRTAALNTEGKGECVIDAARKAGGG